LGAEPYGWGGLHGWAVDLMLHHTLSLQHAVQSHDSPQPRPFTHKTLRFLTQLQTQVHTHVTVCSASSSASGCVVEYNFIYPEGNSCAMLQAIVYNKTIKETN